MPLVFFTGIMIPQGSRIYYFGMTYHAGVQPMRSKEESLKYDNGL